MRVGFRKEESRTLCSMHGAGEDVPQTVAGAALTEITEGNNSRDEALVLCSGCILRGYSWLRIHHTMRQFLQLIFGA